MASPTGKKMFNMEFIKFLISGAIGTCIFYGMYEGLYKFLPQFGSTLSWVVSYVISICFQHFLHSKLVFNNWDALKPIFSARYNKSLIGTYLAYMLSLLLSPAITFLLDFLHVNYRLSFLITLNLTGVINYFTVKKALA